jgi:threonine dehydrogenase-like Zn-dependent dehydrogenase
VDGEKVVTYLEAILQEKLPKSVIVIGSGAIGVEFSTVWSSYGVEVTIVEMLPRLVPLEDEEVSAELDKAFKKRGIKTLLGHKVESVEATKTGVKVTVSAEGATKVLEADQALVRRLPLNSGAGLEEVVLVSERGFVEIVSACNQRSGIGPSAIDRQADVGACRLGDGYCLCREHRRCGDGQTGLRDDAARHLLPAADRLLWHHRSAGQGTRVHGQGGAVSVPGEWQGSWAG